MIQLSINVAKLDKTRFIKGEKGVYCPLLMIETPGNKFGDDYLIRQDMTKEERESGAARLPVVGNARNIKLTPEDEASIPF